METQKDVNANQQQPIVHTPGPWVVDYCGSVGHIKSVAPDPHGRTPTVCKYNAASNSCAPSFSTDVMAANAKLIAAAPELLACLRDIMACGVRELDPRIGYDELQIDRATRSEAVELLKRFGLS